MVAFARAKDHRTPLSSMTSKDHFRALASSLPTILFTVLPSILSSMLERFEAPIIEQVRKSWYRFKTVSGLSIALLNPTFCMYSFHSSSVVRLLCAFSVLSPILSCLLKSSRLFARRVPRFRAARAGLPCSMPRAQYPGPCPCPISIKGYADMGGTIKCETWSPARRVSSANSSYTFPSHV